MITNSTDVSFTQETIQEYAKCKFSCEYFLTNYCYLKHPVHEKVIFNLYEYQKETLSRFENNNHNIVLKGRQLGLSSLIAGYSLWLALFSNEENILAVTYNNIAAEGLLVKVKYMYSHLPTWLQTPVIESSPYLIKFANGSQFKAATNIDDTSLLSLLVLDEAAYMDNVNDTLNRARTNLLKNGKIIINSTPNGINNQFYEEWVSAHTGNNNFIPTTLS